MSESSSPLRIRAISTGELTPPQIESIRALLWAAFASKHPAAGMTEADWQHALGGVHFLADLDGKLLGHASVVERTIKVGESPLRTGYVEAVGVAPERRRQGIGSAVMAVADAYVRDEFELGALGTGVHRFYERLGWTTWRGPSFVATPTGVRPTPDEDGLIMVLDTPRSGSLDLDLPITCDWRLGDVW